MEFFSLLPVLAIAGIPAIISAVATVIAIVLRSKRESLPRESLRIEPKASVYQLLKDVNPETLDHALQELDPKVRQSLLLTLQQELKKANSYKISVEDSSGKKVEAETSPAQAQEILRLLGRKIPDNTITESPAMG